MSGVIFESTGSYQAAFLNGLIWNVVNAVIVALANAAAYPPIGHCVAIVSPVLWFLE
jgi:hypothetical protein